MMANDTAPPDGSSSPSDEGGGGLKGKNAFKKLEQGQKQRDRLVVIGGLVAAGLLVLAGAAIVLQLLFFSDGKVVLNDNSSRDTAAALAPLQCDNREEFSAIPGHPCHLKIQFQERYRALTRQSLPSIEAAATEGFVQIGLAEITKLEEKAIKAFDRSDFAAAVSAVDQALQRAEILTNVIAENFQNSFETAKGAFVANDAKSAQEWIARALRLNGQDKAAYDLSVRIGVLPEVLRLYQLAAEAEIQNQQSDLQKYLQGIVTLDPMRQDISSQLAALTEQLKQAKYNRHLRQATQYIAAENTRTARQEVNKAKALYPARQAISALFDQIDAIERTKRINTMLEEIQALKSQDNWPKVLALYEDILREDNSNRAAINGREKANKIIAANNRAIKILNNQHRLQDVTVHQRTLEFVELIKPLSQDSQTLADTIVTLEQRLELWQKKIKVVVFSDGKSMVIVRRVGRIGPVTQKDIQLKPGKYDFECSRNGFKSKIVEHFVPPGQSGTSVTISCDVRI